MRTARSVLLALGLFAVGAVPAAVALGQPPGMEEVDPGQERASEFRAVTGPQAESVPGGMLLVGAYAVIFLLLLGYIVRLGLLQSRIATDVDRLERSLATHEARHGAEPEAKDDR
jgi:CcmD family protein